MYGTRDADASQVLGPNDGLPLFGPLVLTEMDSICETIVFLLVLFSFNSIISVIKISMITMSNDHHHHCDCCTTQCRQQGLESLVKLTTTSTMKPRWNHISGAISGRFFLNIGRQCFDGEGRPLLFFSIPENPVCSLWDGEGRPSRKWLDGFFFSDGISGITREPWGESTILMDCGFFSLT